MAEEVMKRRTDNEKIWILAMYLLVLLVTLFPLACPYIMEGGRIQEWLVRIQNPRLYWDAEMLNDAGMPFSALKSGLFCLPFSLLYRFIGNPVNIYRGFMVMIQVGTFCSVLLLFRKLFPEKENRMGVFWGSVFYMTNPCRIAICYDVSDLALAVVMMLIPLVIYATVGLREEMSLKLILVGAVALAGIGYADGALFWCVLGCLFLVCLVTGKFRGLLPIPLALLFFASGIEQTFSYLFGNEFLKLEGAVQMIISTGYYPGELFFSFHAPEKLPGMGAGLCMGLLVWAWHLLLENCREERKDCLVFWGVIVFLAILSLKYFPWHFVGQMGEWIARLVVFFRSPTVFWALAQICLCVPAAWSMTQMSRKKEKIQGVCLPFMVYIVCVMMTVWQCNALTFERMPLM